MDDVPDRIGGRWLAALTAAWLCAAAPAAADGTLVIVGGALESDNQAVFEAFLAALPAEGRLVIVPAASGSPVSSARSAAADFVRHGLSKERLEVFPLAVRDDEETPDTDESQWARNGWDEDLVAQLGAPAGFWFTGGDQLRITSTLLATADGQESARPESPLLSLVRARLRDGAVVGGTSAGAAIMSQAMIGGGDSFRALFEPPTTDYDPDGSQEGGALFLTRGLGFLPSGIVDQHFDRKARLGRLVRALGETGAAQGYGIDEDTALVVDLDRGRARVLGRGGVTLLLAGGANFNAESADAAIGLEIGYAAAGTEFTLGRCDLSGATGDPTVGREYFDYEPLQGGGIAFGNQRIDQVLGYDLLDNAGARSVERLSLHEDGRLLSYRFQQTDDSRGWYRRAPSGSRYSACAVRFDVRRGRWSRAD